jgi:radical SAM superfamily enzyme YgiQ (UPF0313 family)
MIKEYLRVLLIYSTLYKKTGLPIGLASICSVLQKNGHEVKIFDTAFYDLSEAESSAKVRAERLMSKKVIDEEKYFPRKNDVFNDLADVINNYKPDIIGISTLESAYTISVKLADYIKNKFGDIKIIAGGVFPIMSPEIVIREKSIDIVCVGEGEMPFLELCNKIANDKETTNISGLWFKKNGEIIRNKPCQLHDLNSLQHPSFDQFDEALFYKPMQGRLFKMVNIATSRGCPYQCTYCAAPKLKEIFNNNSCGRYYRKIDMNRAIEQIRFQIDRHNPEFIYFSSETFLSMTDEEFAIFINEYKKIRLPFWFQTRFETITEERIKKLKDAGMYWLTIGLEHGNEEFRAKILKRKYSNATAIEKTEILSELGIGASVNNMMGFPSENRELIFDTIRLNKQLWNINNKMEFNIFLFAPFRGCELYDLCMEKGLLRTESITDKTDMATESVLDFPYAFKKELRGLLKTFNLYVKLPQEYYPQIKVAEEDNPEGREMFEELGNLLKNDTNISCPP